MTEPVYDVAHLGRVELLTPDLAASVGFFVDVLGMDEVERDGDSVFLRAWGDYERASLQLTAADRPGVGTIAWRATSDAALERRVAAVEASGRGVGWVDGRGRARPRVSLQRSRRARDVDLLREPVPRARRRARSRH